MDNTQVKEKRSVNFAMKIVGWLGHDNKLFDRVCSQGCKGMFNSREHSVCPKCNGQLAYILGGKKKQPMAVSEGTIYPAIGKKQKERDAIEIGKRNNGLQPIYRFKLFSFINEDTGVLNPHEAHDRCRKGAKVEIVTMNHQFLPSGFVSKEGEAKVEILVLVYDNYGDYIKVLSEAEYANSTVTHPVYPDGTAAPVSTGDPIADRMAMLEQKIAQMEATQSPQPAPQPVTQSTPPWQGPNQLATNANDNTVDPLAHAK